MTVIYVINPHSLGPPPPHLLIVLPVSELFLIQELSRGIVTKTELHIQYKAKPVFCKEVK